MLKIHNLQIGDYILCDGHYYEVCAISYVNPEPEISLWIAGWITDAITFKESEIKIDPIYLMEDILTQCVLDPAIELKRKYGYLFGRHKTILPDYEVYFKGHFIKEVAYLHELQQLHNALIGKSLWLKSKKAN